MSLLRALHSLSLFPHAQTCPNSPTPIHTPIHTLTHFHTLSHTPTPIHTWTLTFLLFSRNSTWRHFGALRIRVKLLQTSKRPKQHSRQRYPCRWFEQESFLEVGRWFATFLMRVLIIGKSPSTTLFRQKNWICFSHTSSNSFSLTASLSLYLSS